MIDDAADYEPVHGVVVAVNGVDADNVGPLTSVTYDVELWIKGGPSRLSGIAPANRLNVPTSVGGETIDIQAAKIGSPVSGCIINGQVRLEIWEWPALGPCE